MALRISRRLVKGVFLTHFTIGRRGLSKTIVYRSGKSGDHIRNKDNNSLSHLVEENSFPRHSNPHNMSAYFNNKLFEQGRVFGIIYLLSARLR